MTKGTSAAKALRQSEKARERNKSVISAVKSRTAKAEKLIKARDAAEAPAAVKEATSTLDRAAKKRVVHPNAVARRKSRLAKKFNNLKAATPKAKRSAK
ncbi:MAG TPA: 30S ribosomal protein S20 [Dehalococcoidia bacterium]|nr:30S ribosomal protein S20 [Dehalococcoidia bacterium]